jgi:hypothetical protein
MADKNHAAATLSRRRGERWCDGITGVQILHLLTFNCPSIRLMSSAYCFLLLGTGREKVLQVALNRKHLLEPPVVPQPA